ncbi:hypothetical protein ACDX78_06105 [Virgibacillus oceani]
MTKNVKKSENIIKGTGFSTTAPEQVPQIMDQLMDRLPNDFKSDLRNFP